MNPNDLTEEQRKDIDKRVAQASKALTDLNLTPKASVQATNTGNDIFALKVVVYLEDNKFLSPITKNDILSKD